MRSTIFAFLTLLTPLSVIAAELPKVTLEGRMETQAIGVSEKKKYRSSNPSNPAAGRYFNNGAIVHDTKIDIKVDGKINKDFTYGGLIRLNADTSDSLSKETGIGNKTMFYVQHMKFGRFEAGNMPGAGGLFEMDTVNFVHGSFGVDGYATTAFGDRTVRTSAIYSLFLLEPLDTRSFEFIVSPNIPSNYSGRYYSDAPKVNFFTKPIDEVTLGITFIPDMDSTGTVRGRSSKTGGPVDAGRAELPATFRNIVSGGVVVDKKLTKDFAIKASLIGEVGKAKLAYANDLKGLEAGMLFTYKDFKFGGTYGNWFKSLTLRQKVAGAKQGANYFTLGLGQDIGKFGYSLTYLQSEKAGGLEIKGFQVAPLLLDRFSDFRKNKFNHLVLDVDYKLAPGFLPYATLGAFKFRESIGEKDHGASGILGVRLTF